MITGFKVDFPGAISKYKLTPDLATWGKGIANGFSFCALTGKKEIMDLGGILNEGQEKVFLISTTHGGETNAIRAGIKTIEEFKEKNVIDHIYNVGYQLIEKTKKLIKQKGLNKFIEVIPCPWMVSFIFKDKEGKVCNINRTYFMKCMVENEVLFQGIFIPCFSHRDKELIDFFTAFKSSLNNYSDMLDQRDEDKLTGKQVRPVFRKYN
jgi:glutamate-1-semialdehyde aminotransferase